MNILLAPDSFKGSLTAIQAAKTMEKAIASVYPDDVITMKPMADGGEGTVDVVASSTKNSRYVSITCTGPLGQPIETYYGMLDEHVAVIEIANIAGLIQVPEEERNPDNTTSYGLGEVIVDAIDNGCDTIIIGLGGSATNDGGLGMLQALGVDAFDHNGEKSGMFGRDLPAIDKIKVESLDPRLKQVSIKVASDVNNVLCGVDGATEVYGRQKGANEEQVKKYDQSLHRYKTILQAKKAVNTVENADMVPGSGAAGGLGFALLQIGASLVSGSKLVTTILQMEETIQHADLVLTGEGKSDEQTLFGKAPVYVADLASRYEKPTLLLSGAIEGNADLLRDKFAGCFSTINQPLSLEYCIQHAEDLLFEQTKQVIHFAHSLYDRGKK